MNNAMLSIHNLFQWKTRKRSCACLFSGQILQWWQIDVVW